MNSIDQRQSTGNRYRYKRFTTSLLFRDLRFARVSSRPGDSFPAFELIASNGQRLVNEDIFGGKPVLFIFGSMTCPMTASSAIRVFPPHFQFPIFVRRLMTKAIRWRHRMANESLRFWMSLSGMQGH